MIAAAEPNTMQDQTVAPPDEQHVAALIAEAYKSRTPVYPSGRGDASFDFGPKPPRPGIRMVLRQMNRVLEHASDDLTVTVEAGLTLAELNRRLAGSRQWLPIDAPQAARATLGGIVAANACGPRRFGHGTIGDYLIGFRAMDGRGEAFAGGGRVVKNAAGYNLPRLMVGSLGTLGVITEATFMVRPLPTHSSLVICDSSRFAQAECLLAALGRSMTTPAIVELLAGPALPQCPLPAKPDTADARLVIGFEGNAAEVQTMANLLCDEWQALGADGLTTLIGARVDSVWNWLSESPPMLQINVLPSQLTCMMEQVASRLPDVPLQAHADNGVLRIYSPADPRAEFYGSFSELVKNTLRRIAAAAGGHLTVLAAPPGLELTRDEIWGKPRAGSALMRSIQLRFDPAGILNPGRFNFGLETSNGD
jgi:glycolate oxidase FAD binding subunit